MPNSINPDYDDAHEIVRLYWEEGLSKKQAVVQSGVYTESTAERLWQEVWEKGSNGKYKCENIQKAYRDFKDRIVPFVKSQMPELIDEYLDIAKGASDDSERRKAIKFILETVGGFTKTQEFQMEIQSRFDEMGPEELVEYIESLPGVQVDERQFMAGMFAD